MALPTDDLEFFTTLGSAHTLTEAARHWGVSVAVVSRRLSALEKRLGVALAVRGPRGLRLTPEGERYRGRGLDILQQIHDLEASVHPDPADLTGRIRMISTVGLGRLHIAPLVQHFQRLHPGVQITLELSSLPLSAALPGFDTAIRVGQVPDSTLRIRKLLDSRRVLVASPEYLSRYGAPASLDELRGHNCLVIRENDRESAWHFRVQGRTVSVSVSGSISCNDGLAVTDWCREGAGIAMRSLWHVQDYLDNGELVQVLPEYDTPPADVIALTESTHYTPPRVAALLSHLQRELPRRVRPGEQAPAGIRRRGPA